MGRTACPTGEALLSDFRVYRGVQKRHASRTPHSNPRAPLSPPLSPHFRRIPSLPSNPRSPLIFPALPSSSPLSPHLPRSPLIFPALPSSSPLFPHLQRSPLNFCARSSSPRLSPSPTPPLSLPSHCTPTHPSSSPYSHVLTIPHPPRPLLTFPPLTPHQPHPYTPHYLFPSITTLQSLPPNQPTFPLRSRFISSFPSTSLQILPHPPPPPPPPLSPLSCPAQPSLIPPAPTPHLKALLKSLSRSPPHLPFPAPFACPLASAPCLTSFGLLLPFGFFSEVISLSLPFLLYLPWRYASVSCHGGMHQ
ncbi:unnamed protein product [Closterium sp. NIES-65]|nr:unnamed protein product [Closterium sp. NIES-65]